MSDTPDALQPLLAILARGEPLTEDQAAEAFNIVMDGRATGAQIGALLTAMQVRPGGPTVDELTGAARAMRAHAAAVPVPEGITVIDTCGTGGDHGGTFNISTAAALIAAAAGAHVAKHGNRSVTSACGSSQVLETLGVNLAVQPDVQAVCLREARFCFCFAPAHHPAMKHAIGPRRELGFRTAFNLLGPLTNPAGARRQLMGVFDASLTEPIAHVLQRLGSERAMVVHGSGLDELTTAGPSRISHLDGGVVRTDTIDPEALGLARADLAAVKVDGPDQAAAMLRSVLEGEAGPARDIAALNAAAALVVGGLAEDLADGLVMARKTLDAGAALATLEKLVELTADR